MRQNGRMSGPTLRRGVAADARDMALLHHRCWQARFIDLVSPRSVVTGMDPLRNLERFTRWTPEGSDVDVTVAEVEARVAGYAAVAGHELVHLFVDPDQHRLGLGRVLLTDAEARIAHGGHAIAELHTMIGNEPAIGLYRSAGWVMTDEVIHTDDDVAYDEHVMIKRLGGRGHTPPVAEGDPVPSRRHGA